MSNESNLKKSQLILTTLEELVPQDHMVRKLERMIDWSFIYPLVEPLYSVKGRPSVDPVVLFKMIVINYVFGYYSMRKTCAEIEVNLAYRWFLGYSFEEKVPSYSTWSQNYMQRYRDSDVFDEIFDLIVEKLIENDFIDVEIAGSCMKESANKKNDTKEVVKVFKDDLMKEMNED